jgi:hypothetical protein
MAIKTIDLGILADQTGNLYETVSILAKRSRQLAVKTKQELEERLSAFEGFEPEMEDPRHQEEQARVSLEYELRPEPTEMAITEMIKGEIYFRDPGVETEE